MKIALLGYSGSAMRKDESPETTSWEKVKDWYDAAVGQTGLYYHQHLILPELLKRWKLQNLEELSVLDLGCGQGILARHLPDQVHYLGVDVSTSLIKTAKQYGSHQKHSYLVADATKPLKLPRKDFTHAAILLALQNFENPKGAIENAARHLRPGGVLSLVINHPYFRIPRQSSWGVDESKKLQYRRVDSYMSCLKVPIQTHPGQRVGERTLSFHWPLSLLSNWLESMGFAVECIDEWCSDKKSVGIKAKMENRARAEFPLFMALHSRKKE